MNPYVSDPDFTLHLGDVREVLAELPDESVHCVVTSPPYWGLRDYGVEGQLGLEPTHDEYVQNMVAVFREVRRVLRRDGTCWLNLGDSYAQNSKRQDEAEWAREHERFSTDEERAKRGNDRNPYARGIGRRDRTANSVVSGLKPKDLVGTPWKLAFALQADGWYLRADIIWAKPNPMPESVTDRPTKSHEYLFLLTRSPRYFYDQDAIREPAEWARWGDQTNGKHEGSGSAAGWIGSKPKDELQKRAVTWEERKAAGAMRGNVAFDGNVGAGTQRGVHGEGLSHDLGDPSRGRNCRSVWEIATQPYPEAHFATFPEELARRCILAGTSERGCCPECGAPWERETEPGEERSVRERVTLGWKPSCDHKEGYVGDGGRVQECPVPPVPCTVLDLFLGSGTTALVARRHGRKTIGIELNQTYADLAARRLQQLSLLAEETA